MIVYVAGPYRGKTEADVARNIKQAREIGVALWDMGITAIVPHLNTAYMEHDCSVDDVDRVFLDGDLEILARCDAIVLTPDWSASEGATGERLFAASRHIPIYYWPSEVPVIGRTELERPKQASGFIDVMMQAYRLHLRKSEDYSPANIKGTGYIGLVTRIWDKVARLMNLTGFQVEIESSTYTAPRHAANESIDDSLIDLANYGVIGLLLRRGVWGK